ncbi:MAG: hypothetical protein ACLPTJ_06440 [Solirubrobacteraceae bacterium]
MVDEQDRITIVHVCASDVEEFAGAGRRGLLGRAAPRQDPGPDFSRFVFDHAPCAVVLLWPDQPPALESIRWPPHLR